MGKLMTETAEFKTQKSVQELTQILRQATNQWNAQVERISKNDDPLGGFDEQPAALEVVLSATLGFKGGLKYFRPGSAGDIWAVQVYVYELGAERAVTLVALGEGLSWGNAGSYANMNIKASKDKMEELINILR